MTSIGDGMFKLASIMLAAACWALTIGPASALNVRTFVASTGADTGGCTRAAPCRSFAYAVTQTADGGELDVLDTGGFGVVKITRSISIVNEGNIASIAVPAGGTGIVVEGPATMRVHLRGLTVEGAGVGDGGILFVSGASLEVQRCVIRNFAGYGVFARTPNPSAIAVANSLISDNGSWGIAVQPNGAGTVTSVMLSKLELYNNNDYAIGIFGNYGTPSTIINAQIIDCIAQAKSSGSNVGVKAYTEAGRGVPIIRIWRSTVAGYQGGVRADGQYGVITLSDSNLADTGSVASDINGGSIITFGDNDLRGFRPVDKASKT